MRLLRRTRAPLHQPHALRRQLGFSAGLGWRKRSTLNVRGLLGGRIALFFLRLRLVRGRVLRPPPNIRNNIKRMESAQLRKAWTEANELVREAEERVAAAWAAHAAGKGLPPPVELLADVARLRRECDQRLARVLNGFDGARNADRDHHPGLPDSDSSSETVH